MELNLTPKDKKELLERIQHFMKKEFDEEIGIIASENILEFFEDEIGKLIYNKALDDSKIWFQKRLEDLEVDFDQKYRK